MYNKNVPKYKLKCVKDDIMEIYNISYEEYKAGKKCTICGSDMERVFDSFNSKHGRTNKQKIMGATEKRLDSGLWMKDETKQRKDKAHPDSREAKSNEYWLGNEFKDETRKLSDF